MDMRTIGAARFKEQCLAILENVDADGIVITKRGKPVARLLPFEPRQNDADLIGVLEGRILVDESDDLFSTGAWVSDEWGDLNAQP